MSPAGLIDPLSLIGPARTIALNVTRDNQIFLSPEALGAVDILVEERLPHLSQRFSEGTLDSTQWERIVRLLANNVVADYRAEGVRSINDQDELLSRVRPMLSVYPFDC